MRERTGRMTDGGLRSSPGVPTPRRGGIWGGRREVRRGDGGGSEGEGRRSLGVGVRNEREGRSWMDAQDEAWYGPETVALEPGDVILCDFDGTITGKDTGVAMIDAVENDRGWELELRWREGEIDSRECLREQWALMDWGPEGLEKFLAQQEMDASFGELWELALRRRARLVVVSDGLDLYLDPMMRRLGYEVCDGEAVLETDFGRCVPRFVNHAFFRDGRVVIEFPHESELCDQCANCKLAHLIDVRRYFRRVIYVGDGYSDQCPAKYADLVFAKEHLAEILRREDVPFVAFDTLHDVAEALRAGTGTGFEVLEHTADYAVRARGRNLAELIAAAGRGMISLMVDTGGLAAGGTRSLQVESEDTAGLVHKALRELLYLYEDGEVPVEVRVQARENPPRAWLTVGTVRLEQARERLLGEIKAVTYHNLEIRREGGLLVTEVVFDT